MYTVHCTVHAVQLEFTMRSVREKTSKDFENATKMAALGLWRAQVPLKNIRNQLQMSESDPEADPGLCKGPPHAPNHPQEAQH